MLKQPETRRQINSSGLVVSNQTGIHPHLEKHLRRHLANEWSQPLHQPSMSSYQRLRSEGILSTGRPIILDSGCGTGKSTQRLAELYPEHIVIGVDQSDSRLAKSAVTSGFLCRGNCVLLRAELSTFWRLMLKDDYRPERHYLFYPNPWPKAAHLARRWHGHPVFPTLLALGGEIELRCNWEVYALEFALSVTIATGKPLNAEEFQPESIVSPFEHKYQERRQRLFKVIVPASSTNDFHYS